MSAVLYVVSDGKARMLIAIAADFVQYQVAAVTMLYYFHKATGILPQVQKRWGRCLKIACIVCSLLLFATAAALSAERFSLHDAGEDTYCLQTEYRIFQSILLLAYISFAVVICKLKSRINKIEILSKIDLKIIM